MAVFLYPLILVPIGLGTPLAAEHPFVLASVFLLFSLTGILRWRTLHLTPAPLDPAAALSWIRNYSRHTLLAGLAWGCFACFVQVAYRGAFLQFAILLITAGIVCFASGAFAGDRKLTLTYIACALAPTLIGTASGADGESAVLITMMVIFVIAIASQIEEMNDWFVRSTVESLLLEKSRKEAEAAARVKSEFLANMSHELRTPMNGVMGMLELLLQSELDREQKLLARTSHRSAEALLDILNDILDFSKMSAGKLDFVRQDFLLRNAIEDVYDLLGPRALEKGVDLGYRVDPEVPEWVSGDEGRLRQVLMNLVSNAIKFSREDHWPAAGGVFVEANVLQRSSDSVRISFSVTDQGRGMSPATVAKLFQPFMQADTSTSRRFGGTGLGLAISRQLVEAMGGSITAESQEEVGSRFQFDIALGIADSPHTLLPLAAPCRVLVIEPAPNSLATIGHLLSRHGATATLVSSLTEAAPHLAVNVFHCVIAGVPTSDVRDFLLSRLAAPQPPIFFLFNRGDSIDEFSSPGVSLTRPVRAAQIAELLVASSCLPRRNVPAPVRTPTRLAGHVLIAEDNAVNQMLAQRLVHALGLTAEVVPNGESALAALASRPFHLVLMDCQMPGLDGYETTRRLRQMPATQDLPIVAMTANAMKGDRELCLAAGMNDYVSKPIRLDRLREILSRYLPAATPVPEPESSK